MRCQGPGVQVVALVPAAGPVPPPIMVVTPLMSASSTCCGQMKWMWARITSYNVCYTKLLRPAAGGGRPLLRRDHHDRRRHRPRGRNLRHHLHTRPLEHGAHAAGGGVITSYSIHYTKLYEINWKTKGVAWTFHGTLTGQEAIQANKDIYGDPRFDDLRYQVVDISKVERFDIPDEDMEATAAMDEAATITSPRLAVAVIATEEEAVAVAESYKFV